MSRFASFAASAGLGLGLALVAFVSRGGSELARTTAVEIALVIAGGAVLVLAAARGRLAGTDGLAVASLFALLALVTAGSIAWSIAPDLSWLEANRTLAYAVVFAAAVTTGRLAPGGAPALLRGLMLAAALVVSYSLLARVIPGELARDEVYARIAQPYDYWNAVGVTAALAIPPALWLGARRSGHQAANALAYPLMGLLLLALFLSYSRGALAAALLGIALWLGFVPLRLRSLSVLALPAIGAAPVIAWALSHDAFTKDYMPLAARQAVAGEFGLLLVAMVVGLALAGLGVGFRLALGAPSVRMRGRLGIAAAGFAGALVLLAFGSVALSEPGLAGSVSGRIQEVTSDQAKTSGGPARLTQTSSSRAEYYRQAARIYAERPALGRGAGAFAVARLRYRTTQFTARHAHGYLAQTASDLGLVGLAVTLALALAWLVSAARTLGIRVRGRLREFGSERVALAALTLAVVVFGLQSTIDWTWFVPGPTVMALAAAGFVCGRGAPAIAAAQAPPAEPEPPQPSLTLVRAAPSEGATEVLPPPRRRLALDERSGRLAMAGAIVIATGLFCWAIWQPARSDAHAARALELIEQDRLVQAAGQARAAAEINPLSPRPLLVRAAVQGAGGDLPGARATLEAAVREHPSDPQVWLRLASFQLRTLDDPGAALQTLRGALYLDPQSRAIGPLFLEARVRARESG